MTPTATALIIAVIVVSIGMAIYFGTRAVYVRAYREGLKDGMKAAILGLVKSGQATLPKITPEQRAGFEEHIRTCPDGDGCGVKQMLALDDIQYADPGYSKESLDAAAKTGMYL